MCVIEKVQKETFLLMLKANCELDQDKLDLRLICMNILSGMFEICANDKSMCCSLSSIVKVMLLKDVKGFLLISK